MTHLHHYIWMWLLVFIIIIAFPWTQLFHAECTLQILQMAGDVDIWPMFHDYVCFRISLGISFRQLMRVDTLVIF